MKYLPPVVIIVAGIILFASEAWFLTDTTWGMLFALTLLPALCYTLLTWAEVSVIDRKRIEKSGTLIGSYILFKGVRLFLTIIAIGIYIYIGAPLRMLFVGNVLGLFFLALVCTSIYHLRAEHNSKAQTL